MSKVGITCAGIPLRGIVRNKGSQLHASKIHLHSFKCQIPKLIGSVIGSNE